VARSSGVRPADIEAIYRDRFPVFVLSARLIDSAQEFSESVVQVLTRAARIRGTNDPSHGFALQQDEIDKEVALVAHGVMRVFLLFGHESPASARRTQ
jgi:hypothetical protein